MNRKDKELQDSANRIQSLRDQFLRTPATRVARRAMLGIAVKHAIELRQRLLENYSKPEAEIDWIG